MPKKANVRYKHTVIQYESKEKCKDMDYIVICSEWITTKSKRKFFYWPNKSCLSNKQAVTNCEAVDRGSWLVAPIKAIAHYSDNFYDAVLHTITLRNFNINAFEVNDLKKVHDKVYEFINCPDCSKWLHEIAASLTCDDVVESKLAIKSPACISPQSPPVVVKLPQDRQSDFQSDLLSDRLFTKANVSSSAISTDDSMSPSLLDSYFPARQNVRKRPHLSSPLSIKQPSPASQTNLHRNLSPTSLYINENSATSMDNTMSPSLLDSFYLKRRKCPKTMNVCIRLENKFDEI